jgi:hypothetical protein
LWKKKKSGKLGDWWCLLGNNRTPVHLGRVRMAGVGREEREEPEDVIVTRPNWGHEGGKRI